MEKKYYDIMHFEALGEESDHLLEQQEAAQKAGLLPEKLEYVITPLTVQEWLEAHPETVMPDMITTKTHSVLPDDYINSGNKKSVVTRSAGYDHFEHLSDVANVASLREYCVNAVAQTAIKFLYATAGYLNQYEMNTLTFERNKATSFTELRPGRRATVFGVGKIGQRIYDLLVANGLEARAVDIRENELKELYGDSVVFTSKEEAAENSDFIINAMNLTKNPASRFYNEGYFTKELLSKAKKPFVFINVTRGEIAPESVILELIDKGLIIGFGTDVFSSEDRFTGALRGHNDFDTPDLKAGKELLDRAISRKGNIYVQPHQGFNSDVAASEKAKETFKHVVYYFNNGKKGFAEQLPYYEG